MAKVWVYCWNHQRGGDGAHWGHSSLQIESGPYISWWPQAEGRDYLVDQKKNPRLASFLGSIIGTTNVYTVKHRCNVNYQQDITAEGGRGADFLAEVATGVLNTTAIERWWTGYQHEAASYHVIKKNCSTTVIRALRAGGSDAACGKTGAVDFFDKRRGWEPTDIISYMRRMYRAQGSKVDLQGTAMAAASVVITPQGSVNMCEVHGEPLMSCSKCGPCGAGSDALVQRADQGEQAPRRLMVQRHTALEPADQQLRAFIVQTTPAHVDSLQAGLAIAGNHRQLMALHHHDVVLDQSPERAEGQDDAAQRVAGLVANVEGQAAVAQRQGQGEGAFAQFCWIESVAGQDVGHGLEAVGLGIGALRRRGLGQIDADQAAVGHVTGGRPKGAADARLR